MKTLELNIYGVQDLTISEQKKIEGGILGILVAHALQAALVGSLFAGVYASFRSGYDAV